MNQQIDVSIKKLQRRFREIRKLEYVKSVRKGNTGIGATFEVLIGKEADSLEIPDFEGIEIKTRRGYSKALISLFAAVPTGSTFYEVKRLRDTYGYPDVYDRNLKRLNVTIDAKEFARVGIYYYFRLKVDRALQRLVLCVYDVHEILIDDSTYWDFDILEEKLLRKLGVLAVVKAWPNRIGGVEYFKYYKMTIYLLKGFDSFLKALEEGVVKVKFTIGNYYDEKRYGMVHSHGVGFSIAEEELDKLFDYYG